MPKRPLSPDAESKCLEILQRIAPHYQYHGISVKTCYEDFDRHNIGIITESQVCQRFIYIFTCKVLAFKRPEALFPTGVWDNPFKGQWSEWFGQNLDDDVDQA